MGRKRVYGPEIIKRWMERMLSGDVNAQNIGAVVPGQTAAYAIVAQICRAAIELKKQGKRIEMRVVNIEPQSEERVVVDEAQSEGEVAHG